MSTTMSDLAAELDVTIDTIAVLVDQLAGIDGQDAVITDPTGQFVPLDSGGEVIDVTITSRAADDIRRQHSATSPDNDPMHDLDHARTRVTDARADLDDALGQRDAAIRAALTAGHRVTDIAARAGLTRTQIHTIRGGGGRHRQ